MSRILRTMLALSVGLVVLAQVPAAQAATSRETLTFAATLANVSNNTTTFGNLQYGTMTLQGTSLVKGEAVVVRRDSVIEYVGGSGPIGGFLTVTWTDGSRLSMRVAGTSVNTPDRADFTASLAVFSTSGRWKGQTGAGVMRGTRNGPVGTAVTYTYRVTMTPRG